MTLNTFPSTPSASWPVVKSPNWYTSLQRPVSGRELRSPNYGIPIYTFTLKWELLRDKWDVRMIINSPYDELRTIWAFFNQQWGSAIPFNFYDPSDNTTRANPSVPQVFNFATGDGATDTFQMVSPILAPVIPITVNSVVPTISHTIDSDTGIITFASAPGLGAFVGADFTYNYKLRFGEDKLQAENFLYQLWQMNQVKLTSVAY